jgi:hypothetical protein
MRLTSLGRWWQLLAAAAILLASMPAAASEECCTEAGEIADCWWQDARDDGVFCTDNNYCPSGICDKSFGLGRGLCTCPTDQSQCTRTGALPMAGICTQVGSSKLCAPSFCNGYSVCECYGGCVPASISGFERYRDFCSHNGLSCCEGAYGSDPSGTRIGFCSPDMSCGTCGSDAECEDGDPCTVNERCVNGQCVKGVPKPCNDSNECTVDTCNSSTGACERSPVSDPALLSGLCCDPDVPSTFSDGNVCTLDHCPLVGEDGIAETAVFKDLNVNRADGATPVGCDVSRLCDYESCQVGVCAVVVRVGLACDDATTGVSNGYENLYPVCGAYRCESVAGHGVCVERPHVGVQGLECVSDADDCKDRQCNVNSVSNTYSCDYKLAVNDACNLGSGNPCVISQCDATRTCTHVAAWPPASVSTVPETCPGQSLGAIAGAAVTHLNDNACRLDDSAPIFTGRFSECNIANQSDLVFSFTDQTDLTSFQLQHRRVTVKAQDAGASGYSDIHDWDPLIYVETGECGDPQFNQYTCNNNCFNGFNATNLPPATACAGLDAVKDSAVTSGPWPLEDYPASNVANYLTTSNTRTNYVWVDSNNAAGPPGGEFRLTVTPENHNNNDCRNTGAYVAAPLIDGQESWKERFRGSTAGYTNYNQGKSPGNGPSCWGGGAAGAADPKGAFFRVDLEQGNDSMGAGQTPWPRNYKLYVDPANTSNAFNPVLSFWGSGLPDGDHNCLAGLGTESACYPDGSSLDPDPVIAAALKPYVTREHVVRSSDAEFGAQHRKGWLEVSNYTAGQSGNYELTIVRAPRPFASLGQVFWAGNSATPSFSCSCTDTPDAGVRDLFKLEGYRLDFVPSNDHATGFIVTAAFVGESWLVNPAWAAGTVSGTTRVLKSDELCRGNACATPTAVFPYDMSFAFPYSGELWSYFCVDTAGRVELGKREDPDNPDLFSGNGFTCRNIWDRRPNAGSFTETGTWITPNHVSWGTNNGKPAEGYAPTLAPLWGAIIPCWTANVDSEDKWNQGPCSDGPDAGTGPDDGVITSQIVQFEGTLARVVTWNGFESYAQPANYRRSANEALQFQVIMRADGRFTYAYKRPAATTMHTDWNFVWDRIRAQSGWLIGASGTRDNQACNGAAYDCNAALGVSNFSCSIESAYFDERDSWGFFVKRHYIIPAGYHCLPTNISFQRATGGTINTLQVPATTEAAKLWSTVP